MTSSDELFHLADPVCCAYAVLYWPPTLTFYQQRKLSYADLGEWALSTPSSPSLYSHHYYLIHREHILVWHILEIGSEGLAVQWCTIVSLPVSCPYAVIKLKYSACDIGRHVAPLPPARRAQARGSSWSVDLIPCVYLPACVFSFSLPCPYQLFYQYSHTRLGGLCPSSQHYITTSFLPRDLAKQLDCVYWMIGINAIRGSETTG